MVEERSTETFAFELEQLITFPSSAESRIDEGLNT